MSDRMMTAEQMLEEFGVPAALVTPAGHIAGVPVYRESDAVRIDPKDLADDAR